jgi:hypothetical protein
MIYLMSLLPFDLGTLSHKWLNSKISLIFSSCPGASEPYDFGFAQAHATAGFTPTMGGGNILGVTGVSCGDIYLIAVMGDEYNLTHPDEFIAILQKKLDQFLQPSI